MSWLARSISNNLIITDDDEDDDQPSTTSNNNNTTNLKKSADDIINQEQEQEEELFDDDDDQDSHNHLRDGVKGDLSEFTESLAKQIWGVASFLAPPPAPQQGEKRVNEDAGSDVSNSIREDLIEEREKEKEMEIVGVTEEVLGFAMNIAHHPETWLDFPLSEDEDSDDFEMSDTQWNHATLVEQLVPRLAALRIEFCPVHMSESYFWKVYFVLLHPRLNKHDADLLSTPQIVAARTMWMKELHMQTKPEPEYFEGNTPRTVDSREDNNTSASDSPSANMSERKQHAFEPTTYHTVTETRPPVSAKEEVLTNGASDQRVIPSYTKPIEDFSDDEDNWIHDNSEELDGYEGPHVPVGTDEDISFSDLEDDDCTMPVRSSII